MFDGLCFGCFDWLDFFLLICSELDLPRLCQAPLREGDQYPIVEGCLDVGEVNWELLWCGGQVGVVVSFVCSFVLCCLLR